MTHSKQLPRHPLRRSDWQTTGRCSRERWPTGSSGPETRSTSPAPPSGSTSKEVCCRSRRGRPSCATSTAGSRFPRTQQPEDLPHWGGSVLLATSRLADFGFGGFGGRSGLLVNADRFGVHGVDFPIQLGDLGGDVVQPGKERIDLGLIHFPAPLLLVRGHAELVGGLAANADKAAALQVQLAGLERGTHFVAQLIDFGVEAIEDAGHCFPRLDNAPLTNPCS